MHIESFIYSTDLPPDCIKDCSGAGAVDSAVEYWRNKLKFSVDRRWAMRLLRSSGGWEEAELKALTDTEVAEKILWFACCDFRHATEPAIFCLE